MSTFSYTVQEGNNVEIMAAMPDNTFDFIFADSPYNIQNRADKYGSIDTLRDKNWKPHSHVYDTIDDYWEFTKLWLTEAKRILKPRGSLFATGTHHNIHTIGYVGKEVVGLWIVSKLYFCKLDAMPNIMLTNPTQAVEEIIWFRKSQKDTHYYDSVAAKRYTDNNTNLKTYWVMSKHTSKDFKYPGRKPVQLVYRAADISTNKNEPINALDPFSGSGTTGVAMRQLQHHYLNDVQVTLIDQDKEAISITGARMSQPLDKLLKER